MIEFDAVKNFYPPYLRENAIYSKYILKEYILIVILDFLSSSSYIKKLAFIGGTSIRLTRGIDRFSEDLDFDCKDLTETEFDKLTNEVVLFLERNGLNIEIRENKRKLNAYRKNLVFPQLLFDLGISGHKEERFLIKLEAEDQKFHYQPELVNINRSGYFFPFPVPPVSILCSMKITAMLNRKKGRDFYDVVFLLSQTQPDFSYLNKKAGIADFDELKKRVNELKKEIDIHKKVRDFDHLLFHKENAKRILSINEFLDSLTY